MEVEDTKEGIVLDKATLLARRRGRAKEVGFYVFGFTLHVRVLSATVWSMARPGHESQGREHS